jgi:hypothetical protein
MVRATIASKEYSWYPQIVEVDDPQKVIPEFIVTEQAQTSIDSVKTKFANLPSAGIWADRTESDDELLEELGSGWRGFAARQ